MKLHFIKATTSVALLLAAAQAGWSQGFVNLGFESANLSPIPAGQYGGQVSATAAIPGWMAWGWSNAGTNQMTQVLQNNVTLGANSVSVLGPDWNQGGILQGSYSVLLTAGSVLGAGNFQGVSLSQTGLVPNSAISLFFEASGTGGNFQVSLGGQNLSFNAIATGTNYTWYGANIAAFSGLTETLAFSDSTIGSSFGYEYLDGIEFSATPVPEPGVLGLMAVAGLFTVRRRGKHAKMGLGGDPDSLRRG